MTTNQIFAELTKKRFYLYFNDANEGRIDFLGVLSQLANYSDFFKYSRDEQKSVANKWLKEGEIYIDCDRIIKISK